jgi:NitT/TauT family transport system permease protein
MSTQFESIATRRPHIDAESGDAGGLTSGRALPRGVLSAAHVALAWLASAALTQWWPRNRLADRVFFNVLA